MGLCSTERRRRADHDCRAEYLTYSKYSQREAGRSALTIAFILHSGTICPSLSITDECCLSRRGLAETPSENASQSAL